jgi:DNA mismatch repair protein MutS
MLIDKVTYKDLSIFVGDDEQTSVFETLNLTETNGGRQVLKELFEQPLQSIEKVKNRQAVLQHIQQHLPSWPTNISNGTVLMIEKFFSTAIETIPAHPNVMSATNYKAFNSSDYSLIKFSVTHFVDFFKGLQKMVNIMLPNAPTELATLLNRIEALIQKHKQLQHLISINNKDKISAVENLELGYFFKGRFKNETIELLDMYSLFDAWRSMATAQEKFALQYPTFINSETAQLNATQLRHILLTTPTAYNVTLQKNENFIFLTGANMAGKSTYIKAVGIAVFMAHLGMAIPAQQMELSFMNGLLSNIQVVDNISKGESYFFNEVQRIKNTVEKVNNGQKWLVLIDELFKGTNVQDAMKCSSTVIKGLIKISNSLFILSTHLYEIGEELKQYPNITFKYFETFAINGQLEFSYVLKDGISNDRLGYLILQREGVVDLLEKI